MLRAPCRVSVAVVAFCFVAPAAIFAQSAPVVVAVHSLERAITQAGTAPARILIPRPLVLSGNITVPSRIDLEFLPNGRLILPASVNLTILGNVHAPLAQWIFDIQNEASIIAAPQLSAVSAHWFGARADGVTNDTRSLRLAASFVNRRNGGIIHLLPRIYVVGRQRLAGEFGHGCSWCPEEILPITGNTQSVRIEGNGARLVLATAMRFGSFDPLTGDAVNPASPFIELDYRADVNHGMLNITGNSDVTIRNLELDGNIDSLVLGGHWGDAGYQAGATGIRAYNNGRMLIERVWAHHHGLDGFLIGYAGLSPTSPETPHVMIDVTGEYNARQGLSWVGGIGLHVIRGKFNYTGKARFSSPPGAGLDIEAEDSVIRNGLFEDCEFIANAGPGVVADSGDGGYSTFKRGLFWGTTAPGGWAIWPRKPQMRFEDCIVYGTVVNAFDASNPDDATVFSNCHFEDLAHPVHGVFVSSSGGLLETSANHLMVENSTFKTRSSRGVFLDGTGSMETLRDVTITHGDASRIQEDVQSVLRNVKLKNVRFNEDFPPGTTSRGWYIIAESGSCTNVEVTGPLVRWQHPTGSIGQVCP